MATKRALIIRHVPYEGVAGYRTPIEAAGYVIDRVIAPARGADPPCGGGFARAANALPIRT